MSTCIYRPDWVWNGSETLRRPQAQDSSRASSLPSGHKESLHLCNARLYASSGKARTTIWLKHSRFKDWTTRPGNPRVDGEKDVPHPTCTFQIGNSDPRNRPCSVTRLRNHAPQPRRPARATHRRPRLTAALSSSSSQSMQAALAALSSSSS